MLGRLLGVGPRFFLLAEVKDACWWDGFLCGRLADMRDLSAPYRHDSFVERALKLGGEKQPRKPRIDLSTPRNLVLSASRLFPLVTLHCERIDPDVCFIGRVVKADDARVSLLEITPDATWDSDPSEFLLKDITRVEFGGAYEQALHLVASAGDGRKPSRRR